MLYDHHGIAEVSQTLDDLDQPSGVSLVKAYTRLIEDVQRPYEATPELGGKGHTLTLSAR